MYNRLHSIESLQNVNIATMVRRYRPRPLSHSLPLPVRSSIIDLSTDRNLGQRSPTTISVHCQHDLSVTNLRFVSSIRFDSIQGFFRLERRINWRKIFALNVVISVPVRWICRTINRLSLIPVESNCSGAFSPRMHRICTCATPAAVSSVMSLHTRVTSSLFFFLFFFHW